MGKQQERTIERAIPSTLREAVFAAVSLYSMLRRPGKVRLYWRGTRLRRVEVRGLGWSEALPLVEPDAMDVMVTLQNAGFSDIAPPGGQGMVLREEYGWQPEPGFTKPVWVWEAN